MRKMSRRNLMLSAAATAGVAPLLGRFGGSARAQSEAPPKRLLILYQPQGSAMDVHWPSTVGGKRLYGLDEFDLSGSLLEPLQRHKGDIIPLRGYHDGGYDRRAFPTEWPEGMPDGQHGRGAFMRLTNMPPISETGNTWDPGETYGGGISVDQAVANALEGQTPRHSLVLTGNALGNLRGFTSFSRAGAGGRVGGIVDPREAYTQLFGETTAGPDTTRADAMRMLRRSALDIVRADAGRLRARLPSAERWKMDAQLDAVRSLEASLSSVVPVSCDSRYPGPDSRPPLFGLLSDPTPSLHSLHLRAVAAAFACDVTRVATVMMSSAGGDFDSLRYFDPDWSATWHVTGHRAGYHTDPLSGDSREDLGGYGNGDAHRMMQRVTQYTSTLLSEFIDLLKSIPEGDGTVFDNTLIYWTNEMGHGNHGGWSIPHLLAGGSWGLRTGQMVDMVEEGRSEWEYPIRAKFGDILLSVANTMGLDLPHFGRPELCDGEVPGIHL